MYFSGGAIEFVSERNKLNTLRLNLSFKADDGSYLRGSGRNNVPSFCFVCFPGVTTHTGCNFTAR